MRILLLSFGLFGLFMGWNTPNHYPIWTAFHGELAAAVGVCFLFFGLLWPRAVGRGQTGPAEKVQRLPIPLSARIWLLAAAVPLVQYVAGGLAFRGDAVLGFLYGAGAALSIYVGHLWAAQSGRAAVLKVILVTIVLSAIVACGLAFAQWLQLPASGWWAMEQIGGRPFANFGQPNHFGMLTVIGIIAASALYEMDMLTHRLSHALVVAVLGCGTLISLSRAAQFALLAALLFWAISRRRVPTRLRLRDVLLLLGLALVLNAFLGTFQNMLDLPVELRPPMQASGRRWIWPHFWMAIAQRPWLGYGFGQGVGALKDVAAQVVHPSENTIYAHDFLLDLMTWVGIPLALLATGALAVWMVGWLRRSDDLELVKQRHWVFAMWLVLVVQSLVEFEYAYTYFLLPAALLAGVILDLQVERTRQLTDRATAASRSAVALGLASMALLGTLAYEYLQLEDDFRANRYERANFIGRPAHESLTAPLILDQLAALNDSAHFRIEPGMPPDQITRLGMVARRFHLLPTRMDYAKALVLNGRIGDAEYELQTIRAIYDPAKYKLIERDWCDWLTEKRIQGLVKACAAAGATH